MAKDVMDGMRSTTARAAPRGRLKDPVISR